MKLSKNLKPILASNNKKKAKINYYSKKEQRAAALFLLPSFFGICLFFLFPFLDTVRRSFFNAVGTQFMGISAYTSVLGNSAFHLAATNTAKFVVICIPLLLLFSLAMALLTHAIRPRGRTFKTLFLLPMAVPVASIVLLWQVLFHKQGIINSLLLQVNLPQVDFMETSAIFWVLIFTYLWKNSGYDMILWIAGLDGIPPTQYEAAQADGATAWQCFRYVTMPGLFPTMGLVTVLSLLNSFKVFREAYLVAGAYPNDSIYMLQHLFNNWFTNLDVVRLSAATVLMCAVLLVIIMFLQRFLKEDV